MSQISRSRRIHPVVGAVLLAGTSVLATAALFAALEFGAGVVLRLSPPPAVGEIAGDTVSRTLAYLDINPAPLSPDPDLLWHNMPGARKTVAVNPRPFGSDDKWSIENNSDGYRGPEFAAAKEPGSFRILCVGDSITFGFNADQADSYPAQLLNTLRSRYPDRRIEVINGGVPGWTWIQGLKFLETRGLALHPDLVIMGHGTNDQFFAAKITDEERFLMLGGFVKRTLRRAAQTMAQSNLYHLLGPAPKRSEDECSPECRGQIAQTGSCRRVSVGQIGASVEEAARVVRAAGAEFLVVNTDFLQTAAAGASRAAAGKAGVPFLDLVAALDLQRRADEDARATNLGLEGQIPPMFARAAPLPPGSTKHVVLRVVVPDAGHGYRVEAKPYLQPGDMMIAAARDDGSGGDEKAGDLVFSAALEVPGGVGAIEYRWFREDAPEFEPLPPLASTLGGRRVRVPAAGFGPVDIFGRALFMAEQAHPNRNGHNHIASLIADRLPSLPLFARFLGTGPSQAASRGVASSATAAASSAIEPGAHVAKGSGQ